MLTNYSRLWQYQFVILALILCCFINQIFSEKINEWKKTTKKEKNNYEKLYGLKKKHDINSTHLALEINYNEIIEDNTDDIDDDIDDKNNLIFKSEKIPVKFWEIDDKEKLTDQHIQNNTESSYHIIDIASSSVNFSFYDQLNRNEKSIYDILYSSSSKSNPNTKIKISVNGVTDIKAYIENLTISAERIFTILVYEHPELWWIGNYQITLYETDKSTKYSLVFVILPEGSLFADYTSDNIMALNNEIESVKEEIMKQINNLNITTPYAIMRYIHDYLIIKIVYTLDERYLHIRTLYGSLVENRCVCEGYAEAFQYLAHQYDINCIIGRSSTHEWNFVEMNGKWYIVDVTFDDPFNNNQNTPSGSNDNLRTDYFLIGTDHVFKSGKPYSKDVDHILINSAYSELNMVYYPEIEAKDYKPTSEELDELELLNFSDIIIESNTIDDPVHYYEKEGTDLSELYKSCALFWLICFFIKLSWTQYINISKIIEKESKPRMYEDVIVELESDEDEGMENYVEFYTSEMIPIKYWTNDEKEELQEQVLENIEVSAVDNSTSFKFYNQLSSLEQNYYDYILDKSRELPPSFSVKVSINRDTNDINEFTSEIDISSEKVFTALVYDNPELWWLGTYQLKLGYTATKYIITFITIPENTSFSDYTPDDIVKLNNEIEIIKDSIMSEISRLNLKTKYAIVRYIHDYLIVKNVYTLDENLRHIRTIYGALVENKCVCEGYSEAFQYIAQQYGINCIIGRSLNHEWNFVEIDGKWYVLDATYDDPSSNGKSPPSNTYANLKTVYFLIGTDHICNFNRKYSDDKDHILVYSGFSKNVLVSYPSIEKDDYIPSNIELEEIKLINLSEIAEFTITKTSNFTTTATEKNKTEITTNISSFTTFSTTSTTYCSTTSYISPTAIEDNDFYNYTIPDSSLTTENETISSSFETFNVRYNISIIYVSLIFLITIFLLV